MFFSPLFVRLLSTQGKRRFHPSFNSSYSCLTAHFFQYTDRTLCISIFFTSFGHTYLISLISSSLKINVCQCGHFYTQITGLAHHCSCSSSYLFSHLNFSNPFHPSFSLFMMPFSGPNSFYPVLSGQGGKFLLYFESICFHEQGQGSRTLSARSSGHLSP